jgi:hypothetical protein
VLVKIWKERHTLLTTRDVTYINFSMFKVDVFHPEVFIQYIGKNVSVKIQPSDICNNIILHAKGYMFLLYLSHLQALKGRIHNIIINNAMWDPQRLQ